MVACSCEIRIKVTSRLVESLQACVPGEDNAYEYLCPKCGRAITVILNWEWVE